MAPLYLVDASIYIFRAYFSLPERWHSREGYPLNAVYGYTGFLLDLLRSLGEQDSHQLAFAFDESLGSCFRNRIYPGYKASRELPDEALAFQLQCCREITELLGLACYSCAEYEADDYIASLAAHARARGCGVVIVSRDKDLGQLLLGETDQLWDFAADTRLDRSGFQARFGVLPEQFPDYQGLVGDAIDDIPGVPAVGAKTAARLLQTFPSLEALAPRMSDLDELGLRGSARISASLQQHWRQALLSRQLAQLADDIAHTEWPGTYRLQASQVQATLDYLEDIPLRGGVVNRWRGLHDSLGQSR